MAPAEREAGAHAKNEAVLRRNVEAWPASGGKTAYVKYLAGKKLARFDAIKAKCAECMCGFIDGRCDCQVKMCPLYPFMPYHGKQP